MRKLVVSNSMSLDGKYVVGPDWPFEIFDDAFNAYGAELMRAADTLLMGRTTFEGFRDFWPSVVDDPDPKLSSTRREISRLMNDTDKVVVSNSLTAEQADPWRKNTEIVSGSDAHKRIEELKRQSGHDILIFGSRTLWHDLLATDLVDELHLMVGPIVVGPGTPIFDARPPASLQLKETRSWDGSNNVFVRYEVRPSDSD